MLRRSHRPSWLIVEGVPEPVLLKAGDCFLLPRGLSFQVATDLSLEPPHAISIKQAAEDHEEQVSVTG
jgi:mannose-6-phosphate isomerase-like protein (cupin superfamily)